MPAARDKKSNGLTGEKRDATFHLRALRFTSVHAVFPVATINNFLSLMLCVIIFL
jgi:hypothetical protein